MPTQAEIDRFARWNAAARRADARADAAMTMAERLDAVARLSAVIDELRTMAGDVRNTAGDSDLRPG